MIEKTKNYDEVSARLQSKEETLRRVTSVIEYGMIPIRLYVLIYICRDTQTTMERVNDQLRSRTEELLRRDAEYKV